MVVVVVVVGGGSSGCDGGGGSGDGIVCSVHKINTALCTELVMTFAIVFDRLLFV